MVCFLVARLDHKLLSITFQVRTLSFEELKHEVMSGRAGGRAKSLPSPPTTRERVPAPVMDRPLGGRRQANPGSADADLDSSGGASEDDATRRRPRCGRSKGGNNWEACWEVLLGTLAEDACRSKTRSIVAAACDAGPWHAHSSISFKGSELTSSESGCLPGLHCDALLDFFLHQPAVVS